MNVLNKLPLARATHRDRSSKQLACAVFRRPLEKPPMHARFACTLFILTVFIGCGPLPRDEGAPLDAESEDEVLAQAQALACPTCGDPVDPLEPQCNLGSTRTCRNVYGCQGQQTCVDGVFWGRCTGGATSGCMCSPGTTRSCQPGGGACGTQTCASDGNAYSACTPVSCGVCTPGAKQACDYRGSAGLSHCARGEQTCNAFGSGFGACSDPTFQCGDWSSIDPIGCASTGFADHGGVLINIPSGDSWQAYVLNREAIVFGVPQRAKTFSIDIWGNARGGFLIPNSSCFVYQMDFLQTCSSPFGGSVLYVDRATGRSSREGAGFPCMSNCFGTNVRRVYSSEPSWGHESFQLGFGGPPRCETKIGGPTFPF